MLSELPALCFLYYLVVKSKMIGMFAVFVIIGVYGYPKI